MAKTGGTQVNVGIGIEATPGTPVAATIYPKWSELSLQAVAEKASFNSARGVRNMASNSMIRRRYSEGSLGAILNAEIAPYLYGLALGTVSSGAIVDGTYTHTITVQDANASMKAATILLEEGGIVTERFSNVVANALNLDVSDGYAALVASLLGGNPDTGAITEAFTQETEYAYHQMTVKFGATLAAAAGAGVTPLKAFSLNINNNVLLDEAFLSGANTPVAGGFVAGRLQITGSYSLHFADITEHAKYVANTKEAAIIAFTGAITGGGSTVETITFNLGRLILTSPPKEYTIDGILVLTQEFELEYDVTDADISVVVINDNVGSDY